MTRFYRFVLTCSLIIVAQVALAAGSPLDWTADDIRGALDSPVILFVLMLIGSGVSGLKQMNVANRSGGSVTGGMYWGHWPDTIAMLGGNCIAFVGLIYAGQLNFISALAIGYAVNDSADVLPGKRSDALLPSASATPAPPSPIA